MDPAQNLIRDRSSSLTDVFEISDPLAKKGHKKLKHREKPNTNAKISGLHEVNQLIRQLDDLNDQIVREFRELDVRYTNIMQEQINQVDNLIISIKIQHVEKIQLKSI